MSYRSTMGRTWHEIALLVLVLAACSPTSRVVEIRGDVHFDGPCPTRVTFTDGQGRKVGVATFENLKVRRIDGRCAGTASYSVSVPIRGWYEAHVDGGSSIVIPGGGPFYDVGQVAHQWDLYILPADAFAGAG
jgi:hypothetical protein